MWTTKDVLEILAILGLAIGNYYAVWRALDRKADKEELQKLKLALEKKANETDLQKVKLDMKEKVDREKFEQTNEAARKDMAEGIETMRGLYEPLNGKVAECLAWIKVDQRRLD